MKKISALFMLVAFGMLLSTSCGKETTFADPTVSFQSGITSLVFNGTNSVDVNITFAAEGKIESVSMVSPTSTGTQTTDITKKMGQAYTTNGNGEVSATYFFKVTTVELAALLTAGKFPLTYTFKLVDQEAKETSASFTVTIPSGGTPLAVVKTGMFYHISGANHGAYNLDGDATVAASGTASTKSMKNTDLAGVTFTGSWTSDAANGTMYVKTTSAFPYASATEEAAITAYGLGTASATVASPAIGDVFIGKKGTTYYAIKITAFDLTSKGNNGKITFEYKKK